VIPLRDTIPSRTAPLVTVALIAANVLVFLHETALGPYLPQFIEHYGLVPYVFVHWSEQFGSPLDPARFLPLFTSMFWHGGWAHLLGNMLYLWIFGDNVEDRLGHGRFLLFYVGCGLVAALTQVALSPDSTLPTVGASGAIAGVLGAYLVSFPRSRVLTLVLIWPVEIPAIAYLVFWFVLQVFSGVASLGQADAAGGVAWWAHIGGFLAGIAGVTLFAPRARSPRVRELPL
jgi:membrane associated rhomboid family serine protease